MRRILKMAPVLLLLAIGAGSCYFDFEDDGICVRGSGSVVTQELNLPDFHSISLDVPANVFITQGPVQRVRAEGYANILNQLRLTVRNGVWYIEFRDCVRNIDDLNIYITIPEVRSLRNTATRDIVSENTIITDDLELILSGTGDIDIAADAAQIDARISGTGKIYLEGESNRLNLESTGTGDMKAFRMETRQSDIRISGTGDAEVWVLDYLKVRITGSGDVYYKGNPQVDVSITGTGKVVHYN